MDFWALYADDSTIDFECDYDARSEVEAVARKLSLQKLTDVYRGGTSSDDEIQ